MEEYSRIRGMYYAYNEIVGELEKILDPDEDEEA